MDRHALFFRRSYFLGHDSDSPAIKNVYVFPTIALNSYAEEPILLAQYLLQRTEVRCGASVQLGKFKVDY